MHDEYGRPVFWKQSARLSAVLAALFCFLVLLTREGEMGSARGRGLSALMGVIDRNLVEPVGIVAATVIVFAIVMGLCGLGRLFMDER